MNYFEAAYKLKFLRSGGRRKYQDGGSKRYFSHRIKRK